MKQLLIFAIINLPFLSSGQVIQNATPTSAVIGIFFEITIETSSPLANPYAVSLKYGTTTITPWTAINTINYTYVLGFILRDFYPPGGYSLTIGASTYPQPIYLSRPQYSEKFLYDFVQAPLINVTSSSNEGIRKITTDSQGNIYYVGAFAGTATIGTQTITAAGTRDGFIAKFDSTGAVIWVKQVGSSNDDDYHRKEGLLAVEIFNDTILYVAGHVKSNASLTYNNSLPLTYPVRNIDTQDGIVMKLDSAGNYIWHAFQGSRFRDATNDLKVSADGKVYVTGFLQGDMPTVSGVNDTCHTYVYSEHMNDSIRLDAYTNDQYGLYLARYSSTGQLEWARRQDRDYFSQGANPYRMALGSDNSIMVLANTAQMVKYGGSNCSNSSCCNSHFILLKTDSLGNRLWCLEDGNFTYAADVGIDQWDNTYIAYTTNWIGGESSAFLRKYDPLGNLLWSEKIHDNKHNGGGYVAATDGNGNTYVGFAYQKEWATGGYTVLLKKFDGNGNELGVTYPMPFTANNINSATAIALNDNEEQIYFAGSFMGSQTFGNTVVNALSGRVFFNKISFCPVSYHTMNVNSCGPFTTPSGIHTWNTSGIFYDTLVNSVGCDSVIIYNLTILTNTNVSITAQGPTTFCQGGSVVLSASPSLQSYQWYRYGWPIPGATSAYYTATGRGNYYCIAESIGFCPDTSNTVTVSVPCIQPDPPVDKISDIYGAPGNTLFYPNPVTKAIHIKKANGTIKLYNFTGSLLIEQKINDAGETIDVTGYTDGLYFLHYENTELLQIEKVVILGR